MPEELRPPDLRAGDCVQARREIEYETMPTISVGQSGMVIPTGIAWEGMKWAFDNPNEGNRFSHYASHVDRDMVEKMDIGRGYGSIADADPKAEKRNCLTVFLLKTETEGGVKNSKEVKPFPCVEGWTEQLFIYPGCGCGPGQIRWTKDPDYCLVRSRDKIDVELCQWTRDFVWEIKADGQLMWKREKSETEACLGLSSESVPELQLPASQDTCRKGSKFWFSGFPEGKCIPPKNKDQC